MQTKSSKWIFGACVGIFGGVGMIFVHQIRPGWERGFLETVCVFAYVLLKFRSAWKAVTYWVVLGIFAVLHLILLPRLSDFLNRSDVLIITVVTLFELILLIVTITFLVNDDEDVPFDSTRK